MEKRRKVFLIFIEKRDHFGIKEPNEEQIIYVHLLDFNCSESFINLVGESLLGLVVVAYESDFESSVHHVGSCRECGYIRNMSKRQYAVYLRPKKGREMF